VLVPSDASTATISVLRGTCMCMPSTAAVNKLWCGRCWLKCQVCGCIRQRCAGVNSAAGHVHSVPLQHAIGWPVLVTIPLSIMACHQAVPRCLHCTLRCKPTAETRYNDSLQPFSDCLRPLRVLKTFPQKLRTVSTQSHNFCFLQRLGWITLEWFIHLSYQLCTKWPRT
jgi:hypothetical protein